MTDDNYSMWYKGQLLVILSRTKLSKDNIFVGYKESILNALVHLLGENGHIEHNIWKRY